MIKKSLFSLLLVVCFVVSNVQAQEKKQKKLLDKVQFWKKEKDITKLKPNFKYKKKEGYDYVVTIDTDLGRIHMVLFDDTPLHKGNFLNLIGMKFYDSTIFHTVLDDFIIQGGDPFSKISTKTDSIGTGGPGYSVPSEFDMRHKNYRGVVGMARQTDGLNPKRMSSGSQFYILQRDTANHLDGKYTVFGVVVDGMDVVDEIAKVPVDKKGMPVDAVRMTVFYRFMKKEEITKKFGYEYVK